MRLLFLFIILIPSPAAFAEYRAFVLQIKSPDGTVTREFPSTLDPDQYRGYYPVQANERISYVETWRCPGRTGDFQPICPNPRAALVTPAAPTQP